MKKIAPLEQSLPLYRKKAFVGFTDKGLKTQDFYTASLESTSTENRMKAMKGP